MRSELRVGWILLLGLTSCSGVDVDGGTEESIGTTTQPLFNTNWSGYLGWGVDDVATVSRGTNLLDLFSTEGGTLKYHRYATGTWHSVVDLGKPPGISTLSSVAATKNGTRIDVFAVGSDQHIWHRFTTSAGTGNPTWDSSWYAIMNNPTVLGSASIAVSSWEPGRLDLFWWTPSKNLGHAYATGYAWAGTETGDTPGNTYLQPIGGTSTGGGSLDVVSWGPGRLDIFFVKGGTLAYHMSHHWYDSSASGWWWSPGVPARENFFCWNNNVIYSNNLQPSDIVATTTGSGQLELVIRALEGTTPGVPDLFRTSFNGTWPIKPSPPENALIFDRVEHSETGTPSELNSAIRWNAGARLDLFGQAPGTLWQAYKL